MPKFENVSLRLSGHNCVTEVLRNLSLVFPEGKTTLLTGPSGCGKTTCLRLLAGLISPDSGTVTRETPDVACAVLFQNSTLFPWLTAIENVNLVLSDKQSTMPLAMKWLDYVGLSDKAADFPSTLSGGMKQRVALAQALAADAPLLLLDEPFRGLDADLHLRLLSAVHAQREGKTTIIVSHDPMDQTIADRVVTFRGILDSAPAVEDLR